ncbi:MAG TPA: hypothetical protein VER17_16525 [Tepidisphaeraceae bacterium]|nr:hypothetical protein [Tepidisphaeraceae bacterium]
MSSIVPQDRVARIEFYENHAAAWTASAVAMGSSAPVVAAVVAKATAARAKFEAAQQARQAAKVATVEFYDAVDAMARAGADVIKQVKVRAAMEGNNNAYNLAQIPPPAIPGPAPAPGLPSNFKVQLLNDGSLEFTWKCHNPGNAHGAIYQVYRRIGAAPEYEFVGASGMRKWIDATLPAGAGAGQVTYRVRAVRSTAVGPTAEFNVNFGVGGSGQLTASVSAAPRIAA